MPEKKKSGNLRPLFFPYKRRLNIDIYMYTSSMSVQWWMVFPCERLPLFSQCDGLSLGLVVLPPAVCSTLTAWKGKAAWSLASAGDSPACSLCVHFKDLVTSRRHHYPDKNPQLQSNKSPPPPSFLYYYHYFQSTMLSVWPPELNKAVSFLSKKVTSVLFLFSGKQQEVSFFL